MKRLLIFIPVLLLLVTACTTERMYDVKPEDSTQEFPQDSFEMKPEDCFEGEQYDPVEKVCYFECDSDEECDRLEKEIYEKAEQVGEDFYNGKTTIQEASHGTHDQQQDFVTLNIYSVSGKEIILKKVPQIKSTYKKYQDDTQKHQIMWNRFSTLLPLEAVPFLKEFQIVSDGKQGIMGAVEPMNTVDWRLQMDPADAFLDDGSINEKELTYTLIHEYGHLITANSKEMEIYPLDISDEQLQQKESECTTYFAGDGCARSTSYIYKFKKKFWEGEVENEWNKLQKIESDEEFDKASDKFMAKFGSQFVTDYAVTSVDEDISESWTAFVLKDKPAGNSIVDQKIKFFYEFEELVRLRKLIRAQL